MFFSTLLIGIANGTVEAACNPLVASLFPENKTTKLNHFHLWFPAGIVIGTLIVFLLNKIGVSWQVEVATMLIPTLIYGYLFSKLKFPVTERVAAGVSNKEMYKSVFSGLFIFMIICMFGTAITELFTGQWIDVLFKNVTDNALLILTFVATGSWYWAGHLPDRWFTVFRRRACCWYLPFSPPWDLSPGSFTGNGHFCRRHCIRTGCLLISGPP